MVKRKKERQYVAPVRELNAQETVVCSFQRSHGAQASITENLDLSPKGRMGM